MFQSTLDHHQGEGIKQYCIELISYFIHTINIWCLA